MREKPAEQPARTPSTPATTAPATEGAKNPLLLAPPPAPAARTGRITADDGRCLDLFANNPADGNRIQLFTCNGTSAQTFTLATDGTLRVRDMCADVSRWAMVRITGCGDRDVTHWRVGGNGTLTSASSGRCLTRSAAGRESVAMTRCSGSAAQKWALPS
ncbi:RICIN domain-containing protein [Actinoplanes sp. NPDC051470]|uniref:RICIN domain-containing protein n=1 Tax=Actinoplanes sp. NPDC051470 TaxID=3157224 RepID=UPI00343DD7A3